LAFPKKELCTPEEWAALMAKRKTTRAANRKPVESVDLTAEFDDTGGGPPDQGEGRPPAIPLARPSPDDILSKDEIEAIYAGALASAHKERKEARRKEIMEKALEEARRGAGMIAPATEHEKFLAELVDITIRLPRLRMPGGKESAPDPIIIDQQIFHNGVTRRVPRGQAQYLMDLMWRAKAHAAQVDGRGRHYYDADIGGIVYLQPGQTAPFPTRHVG
jgi:hypothetical protein